MNILFLVKYLEISKGSLGIEKNPNFYYQDKRSRQRAFICACFDSFIILSEVAMPFNFELAISTR